MSDVSPSRVTKGQARRSQILNEAGRLFGERGYDGVSLRDIAAAVGITHPLLVHYFATKDDLLLAVIGSWNDRATSLGLIGMDDSIDRPARMVQLAADNARIPGYVALFTSVAANAIGEGHPAHDTMRDRYETAANGLERFFNEECDKNNLRDGISPKLAARSVLAIQDGAQIQWLYDPEHVSVPELVRSYLQMVLIAPFRDTTSWT